MTTPITPTRQAGLVVGFPVGPGGSEVEPPTVLLQLAGDEDHLVPARFFEGYTPFVGDAVEVLTYGGSLHRVLGKLETKTAQFHTVGVSNTAVVGITTTPFVELVRTSGPLRVNGVWDVQVTADWSSFTQTAGAVGSPVRIKLQIEAASDPYSSWTVLGAQVLPDPRALNVGENGGCMRKFHVNPAVGEWKYRLTAAALNAGTFTANTGGDGPISISAERWV